GAAAVEVRRAEPLTQQAPEQQALLAAGAAGGDRGGAGAGTAQRRRRLRQRALPRDRAQEAAVAQQRLGHALVDVERLIGEAALVAQPAVVDVVVLARE